MEVTLAPRPDENARIAAMLRRPEFLDLCQRLLRDGADLLAAVRASDPAARGGAWYRAPASPPTDTSASPQTDADLEIKDRLTEQLEAVFIALSALQPGAEDWYARPDALQNLERTAAALPRSAAILLLLAEARLQHDLPQQSITACTAALRLAPERVEFFGDEIDRITEFNPLTGAKQNVVKHVAIFPASHYIVSAEKKAAALEKIRAECDAQVKQFTAEGKLIEAQRIAQRTNYDIEMLNEVGMCKGIENYSAVLSGRAPGSMPTTLLDYFPDDFLLFVDESHVTLPQVRAMYGGDYARKKTLVEYGFRLPSAFDNRPLKFEEVESKLNQMIFVSATPGDYERQNSTQVAQQVIRPTGLLDPLISVRPVEGQVVDLLGEINTRIQRHERVLVTTLTKKMAEDLTDYLTEQGIKVKYMHHEVDTFERMEIIKDLRLGSIDVVVGINLLREGLDLPEVSLVAILDADKEGFLRSETSLIQTIGRAARNAEGLVIMYADVVTDSMDRAITETERRRAIQMAYNKEHGIVPKTIVKAIADSIEISDKAENAKLNTRRMGRMEREAAIERLTREMKEAAKLLEFEHAAFLRDQIDRLRRGENPTVDSAAETERKQNHSQTQRKGRKYLGKR